MKLLFMTGLIAGTCELCLDCSLGLLLLFRTSSWTAATSLGLLPASWTGCLSVFTLLFILLWTHLLPLSPRGGATCLCLFTSGLESLHCVPSQVTVARRIAVSEIKRLSIVSVQSVPVSVSSRVLSRSFISVLLLNLVISARSTHTTLYGVFLKHTNIPKLAILDFLVV